SPSLHPFPTRRSSDLRTEAPDHRLAAPRSRNRDRGDYVHLQHPLQGATADPKRSIEVTGPRIPIYSEEFAADPHGAYRRMREMNYGPLVPVEMWPGVPATLVIKYSTAVRILGDSAHFPADPSVWQ